MTRPAANTDSGRRSSRVEQVAAVDAVDHEARPAVDDGRAHERGHRVAVGARAAQRGGLGVDPPGVSRVAQQLEHGAVGLEEHLGLPPLGQELALGHRTDATPRHNGDMANDAPPDAATETPPTSPDRPTDGRTAERPRPCSCSTATAPSARRAPTSSSAASPPAPTSRPGSSPTSTPSASARPTPRRPSSGWRPTARPPPGPTPSPACWSTPGRSGVRRLGARRRAGALAGLAGVPVGVPQPPPDAWRHRRVLAAPGRARPPRRGLIGCRDGAAPVLWGATLLVVTFAAHRRRGRRRRTWTERARRVADVRAPTSTPTCRRPPRRRCGRTRGCCSILFCVFLALAVSASVAGSQLLLTWDEPITRWVEAHRTAPARRRVPHVLAPRCHHPGAGRGRRRSASPRGGDAGRWASPCSWRRSASRCSRPC